MREAIAIGTPVTIRGGVDGWIAAVCFRGKGAAWMTYEVSWWDGRQMQEHWFPADEIAPRDGNAAPLKIGFTTP